MSSIFRNSSTRSSMAAKFALINTRGGMLSWRLAHFFVVVTLSIFSSALAMLRFFLDCVIFSSPSLFVCKDSVIDFPSSSDAYVSLRLKFLLFVIHST